MAGWMMAAGAVAWLVSAVFVAASAFSQQTGLAVGWPPLVTGLMLIGAIGLALLGTVVGVLGLGIYVLVPALSSSDRARKDFGSHRVVLACVLLSAIGGNLLAAVYVIPVFLMGPSTPAATSSELAGHVLSPVGIAVSAVSLDLALLAVVYLRVVRQGAITWQTMGLSVTRVRRSLLPGALFGLLLFGVSALLELLLDQLGVRQTQTEIFQSVRRASLQEFGLVLLAGAVIAPIAEEIFFRGYVFRAYLEQKGLRRAFLFSAGLFALVHLSPPAFLPIFAMGLLLALLYYRTGSLMPGIIAHAINNAVAFTFLYLGLA